MVGNNIRPIQMKPSFILIHCTDLKSDIKNQLQRVNQYHKEQDFPFSRKGWWVGYHAFLENGVITYTRLESELGAHCNTIYEGKSMNEQSLGICVAFDGDVEHIPEINLQPLKDLIKQWQHAYSIPDENVRYHRHFNRGKSCPGNLITDDWLKAFLKEVPKPAEQEEKQKEILRQKISLLTQLLSLWTTLKNRV